MRNSSENEENSGNNSNEESNRPACAACKHQRKRCKKGCPFLLHFPANRHEEFSAVHQIFGIANMNKMMKDIDLVKQGDVVESIIWEAMTWTNRDHKEHGPYGVYKRLEEEYQRLREENRQLKEQLLKSQQELQFQPKSPGFVSKSSWQGANSSTDVKGLSGAENYSGYSDENENLLLNSTVNSYSSLLEGYDRETQGSTSNTTPPELGFPGTNNSTPPGIGFAALPWPSFFFRQEREQEHQMREGPQEKGHHLAVLPARPREAMLPQSIRPVASGQLKRSQLETNISNYSGPPASSLKSRRLSRYHPYSLPQHPHPSMQNNPPQRGFGRQYPLVYSSMQNNPPQRALGQQYPSVNPIQNNVAEECNEVKSKAAEEEKTQ